MECLNPGNPSRIVLMLLTRAGVDVLSPLLVLDLTYGRGTWWAEAPQAAVYGVDVRKLDWARAPRCFRLAPAQRWREFANDVVQCLGGPPQVVAADPPWGAEGGLLRSLRRHWQKSIGSRVHPPRGVRRCQTLRRSGAGEVEGEAHRRERTS